jgi:hypothetical protein
MIRIASRKEGFRRAGIAHTLLPVTWPNDYFTKEQLDQLKAEPILIVDMLPGKPGPKAVDNPVAKVAVKEPEKTIDHVLHETKPD